MPGIAGIISDKPANQLGKNLERMLSCMMHEDFYHSGTYIDSHLNILTGWVYMDGSSSECMPVFNDSKDIILIFSGENHSDSITQIKIEDKINAENILKANYIIHLYEEKGELFVKELNGWFSGILIDLRNNVVHLFNDRFGINRIYYYQDSNEFIFSSEAKSILSVRNDLKDVNTDSLGDYFHFGCVLNNKTLFKDIEVIPPGSLWTWKFDKDWKKRTYFYPDEWKHQSELDIETFFSRLSTTFYDILPRYLSAASL